MNRSSIISLAFAAVCLLSVSCGRNSVSSGSGISTQNSTQQVTSATENEVTQSTTKESVVSNEQTDNDQNTGNYEFHADTVKAEDIYNCKVYNVPENIDGYEYYLLDIYDKNKILTQVFESGTESVNSAVQVGVYDLTDNSFLKMFEMNSDDALAAYDNDYYILYEREDHSANSMSNDYSRIYLYNAKDQTQQQIMKFDEIFSSSAMNAGTLLYNNCVYFTTITYCENAFNSEKGDIYSIFRYDIQTGELTKLCEDAYNPIIANGRPAAYFYDEKTKDYTAIRPIDTENDDFSFNMDNNTMYINITDDGVFAVYRKGQKKTIRELDSQTDILSTDQSGMEYFEDLKVNSSYAVWNDISGEKQTPYIYDLSEKKLVEFSNLHDGYYRCCIKDDYGFIESFEYTTDCKKTGHTVCIFEKK
ncbi:MAG: hypothetical protein Q4F95_03745 [Oscillospiraceae bacterium]|nr:hypothetical protein [Oscillospiraceae bacterium]